MLDKEKLEAFYGKPLQLADRETVESESAMDEILSSAREKDVGFLVVGDPLCATTHTDLILRAIERKVEYKVIHNASGNIITCTFLLWFIQSILKRTQTYSLSDVRCSLLWFTAVPDGLHGIDPLV